MIKGDQEVIFEEKDNVMYRIYKHPKVDGRGSAYGRSLFPKR